MKLSHMGMLADYVSIIKTSPLLTNNLSFLLKFPVTIKSTFVATGAIIIICEAITAG